MSNFSEDVILMQKLKLLEDSLLRKRKEVSDSRQSYI